MTSWPKSVTNSTNISMEVRQEIMLNERLRLIEERIKTLENKQK